MTYEPENLGYRQSDGTLTEFPMADQEKNEWRPEGFENPYPNDPNIIPTVTTTNLQGTKNLMHNAYEAGADAMLAALKAGHPCHVNAEGMSINFPLGVIKGSFVFIPDAPVEAECPQ